VGKGLTFGRHDEGPDGGVPREHSPHVVGAPHPVPFCKDRQLRIPLYDVPDQSRGVVNFFVVAFDRNCASSATITIDGDLCARASHEILQVFAAFTNESACGRIGNVQRHKHAVGADEYVKKTIRAVVTVRQGGVGREHRSTVCSSCPKHSEVRTLPQV
jgi:hypothetical protein